MNTGAVKHPDDDGNTDHTLPMIHAREDGRTNQSFAGKLRRPTFRRKFFHTGFICLAFIMLGWVEALFGPTFPDLRDIINVPLNTASWLFTASSGGFFVGSILTGILYERYNTLLLLICSLLGAAGAAGTTAAIPWCERFYLMMIVKFVCGTLTASLDTGGNSEVVQTWGKDVGPYMQALHFCFALGGMIAPSVAEPFLTERRQSPLNGNTTRTRYNETMFYITSDDEPDTTDYTNRLTNWYTQFHKDAFNDANAIAVDTQMTTLSTPTSNTSTQEGVELLKKVFDNDSIQFQRDMFPTHLKVHNAYLITAILTAMTALPFIIMFYMKRNVKQKSANTEINEDPTNFKDVSTSLKILILMLLSSLMFLYCGTEDTFAGLLMTFCISQLQWSKSSGSFATSVHWICFGFTRLGAIYFVRYIKTHKLLYIFSILMVLSFSCLLISSLFNVVPMVWISIGCSGFSMSVVFPAMFTWTNERIVAVSGRISAMFLAAGSLGIMLIPLAFGYTMERFSSMWFIYLLLGQSVLWVMLYTCTLMLVCHALNPRVIEVNVTAEEEEMIPMRH